MLVEVEMALEELLQVKTVVAMEIPGEPEEVLQEALAAPAVKMVEVDAVLMKSPAVLEEAEATKETWDDGWRGNHGT